MSEKIKITDRRKRGFILKEHKYIDFWLPFLVSQQKHSNDVYDVLLRLINNQEGHERQGHSWPSYATMQKKAGGIAKSTLSRCLSLLEEHGLIHVIGEPGKGNIYEVMDTPEPSKDVLDFLEELSSEAQKMGVMDTPEPSKDALDFLDGLSSETQKMGERILQGLPIPKIKKEPAKIIKMPSKKKTAKVNKVVYVTNHWKDEHRRILSVDCAKMSMKEAGIIKKLLKLYRGDYMYLCRLMSHFIEFYSQIPGYTSLAPTLPGLLGFKESLAMHYKKNPGGNEQNKRKVAEL